MRAALLGLAGVIWLAVGAQLAARGLKMLALLGADAQAPSQGVLTALAFGLVLGAIKGKLILSRAALRNRLRIAALPAPARPWQVFAPRFYPLVGLMILFGVLLRRWGATGETANLVVGGVYTGIGTALFVSAFAYPFPRVFARHNPWLPSTRRCGPGRVGVLLANLGTPDDASPRAVGRFLREFLSDRRVIEVNPVVWWFILNLFIVPLRRYTSAELYKRIITKEGSPLLLIGQKQSAALQQRLGSRAVVELGMRYGQPSITEAFATFEAAGVDRVVVLPAYPQYSGTTTASIYDAVYDAARRYRHVPALRFAAPYADDQGYIAALAALLEEALADFEPDRILMSFHGIPQRYADRGDPYCCDCQHTSRALATAAGLERDRWELVYQSRFGNEPWLQPYIDERLVELAESGVKKLLVICPGFLVDCLETIDEIGDVSAELFVEAGGDELRLVPCLNDHPVWIDAMTELVERESLGWLAPQTMKV